MSEDAGVGDALGSHRSREGAGFWEAVRANTAPVTPASFKARPCRDPGPFPPLPPHLLPRQCCPPAPGHPGGEGGGPGRGAEVLRGDGQELGDAELLRHGGRGAGAPGLLEWGAGRRERSLHRAGLASLHSAGAVKASARPTHFAAPRPRLH